MSRAEISKYSSPPRNSSTSDSEKAERVPMAMRVAMLALKELARLAAPARKGQPT